MLINALNRFEKLNCGPIMSFSFLEPEIPGVDDTVAGASRAVAETEDDESMFSDSQSSDFSHNEEDQKKAEQTKSGNSPLVARNLTRPVIEKEMDLPSLLLSTKQATIYELTDSQKTKVRTLVDV